MSSPPKRRDEDRLFVRNGWRHFRRRYSLVEVRWGLLVLAIILAVGAWVAHKGRHPDPALFAAPELSASIDQRTDDRSALPEKLAATGWTEGKIAHFDSDNLYEKIDGRADYYKSFGFQQLTFVTLRRDGGAGTTVDIELYDLGQPQNALGAYAGERSEGTRSTVGESGLSHIARNALMMTQGRFYLRAIGSDETPATVTQLRRLEALFRASLPASDLPWGYALFVGQMGVAAEKVSYAKDSAFSFGFARDVYIAHQSDETTALFVTAAADDAAARRLAVKFEQGFSTLGDATPPIDGVSFYVDRFLGTFSAVATTQRWVTGVYRGATRDVARQGLRRLRAAIGTMPAWLVARAMPAVTSAPEAPASAESGKAESYSDDNSNE